MSITLTAWQKRAIIKQALKVRTAREFVSISSHTAEFRQSQKDGCFIAKLVESATGLRAGSEHDFMVENNKITVFQEGRSTLSMNIPDWASAISRSCQSSWKTSLLDLACHFHALQYSGEHTLHTIFPNPEG